MGRAIGEHDASLIEGGVDFGQVDTDDGDKIVKNVFGDNRDQVVNQLAGAEGRGGAGDLIGKLLPMLAPIVMAYLSKQFSKGGGTTTASGDAVGLGDLLGGLLGGASAGQSGGTGDLLGGLLGGGRR